LFRLITQGRRPLGIVLGALLFALVLETTPHLVHHLFEQDEASGCEFLTAADHDPAIVDGTSGGLGVPQAREMLADTAPATPCSLAIQAAASRGPPRTSSARL